MAWLICGRCGRHNAQGSESCVSCGTDLNEPLPQQTKEVRSTVWLICGSCGRHNAQGSESCVSCGTDLNEPLPQHTKEAQSTVWLICGRCGRHNAQGSESCVSCGTDLNEPLPQQTKEAQRTTTSNRVVWAVTIPVVLLVFGMCVAVVAPTAEPEATPSPYLAVAAPTALPTPTAEPEATPSPNLAVAAVPTAAPTPTALLAPTAAPTPAANREGLGLSLADLKRAYKRLEFEDDRLTDGRRRWMASSGSVLVEAIGDPENLEQTTLMIDTGMPPKGAEDAILYYLTVVLQDGLAAYSASASVAIWMEGAAYRFRNRSHSTHEGTREIAGFEIGFFTSAAMPTITLTIEKEGP